MSTTTVATIEGWMAEPISKKNVLVEWDIGKQQAAWYNVRAGVWGHKFYTYKETYHSLGHGNLGYGPLGGSDTSESGNKDYPITIGSVRNDTTTLTGQGSLASVQATVESFYYDYNASTLYVHCTDHNDPLLFTMIVGITLGLSNNKIHINGVYYEPRVLGVPALTKEKDPLFYGIIKHDGGSIEIDNHDGYFDAIANDYIFGQPVVIKYGGDYHNKIMPYTEYRTVFTGHVESMVLDWEHIILDVVHEIKRLAKTIPVNKYNTTDFPNLDADDLGYPRPIGYGEIYNAKVVCTNKAQGGSSEWIFECADTGDHPLGILSVTAAYKAGISVTISTASVLNGSFTISYTQYTPTATDRSAIWTADYSGFIDGSGLITNACEIIKDIMSVYASVTYNSTNYDDTEWDTEDNDALDCALFINDEINIDEAIEKLGASTFGVFIEKDDGRYTFRIVDITASASETISKNKVFGSPGAPHDGLLFLSSCKVGYKKNWQEKSYRWLNDTTDETDIAAKHNKYNERKFETLLTNSTDAQTLATRILDYYKKVKPDIVVRVPIEYVDFEIGDIINIETDRYNKPFMGTIKTEIVSITKNIGLKDEMDYIELMGRAI